MKEIELFTGRKVSLLDLKKHFKSYNSEWTIKGATIQNNRQISAQYLQKAQKYLPYLRFLPGVQAVAVVNTVAFASASKSSDIDLFIITKKGCLWTARLLITFFLHILGVRRHGQKIAGRFCLSFFADEQNLDLEKIKIKHDPFLAFWISSIVPIFGDFSHFAKANKAWVKKEVGIELAFEKRQSRPHRPYCFCFLEKLIKTCLLPRTQKKAAQLSNRSGTIISDGMLKFHDRDRRGEVAEKYRELVKI